DREEGFSRAFIQTAGAAPSDPARQSQISDPAAGDCQAGRPGRAAQSNRTGGAKRARQACGRGRARGDADKAIYQESASDGVRPQPRTVAIEERAGTQFTD